MEERQVSVDGTTYLLERPFMVVATQNPIEMEGTYPLPEAQRDRFTARIAIGYPTPSSELDTLDSHGTSDPLGDLSPVTDGATVKGLIDAVKGVYVSPAVKHYLVQVVNATRTSRELRLGASPRADAAAAAGQPSGSGPRRPGLRSPDDVAGLATAVLAHRVLLVDRSPAGPSYGRRRGGPSGRLGAPARPPLRRAGEDAQTLAALHGPRPRVLVVVGLLVVIAAMVAGQRDVMRIGLLLLALPVIAAVLVARARLRLSCERSVEPPG